MSTYSDPALILPSSVSTLALADGAVTTVKIADANVTTGKIDDGDITTVKIADSNVTTGKLADSAVTTIKIADSNVTTGKLADSAVTAAKTDFLSFGLYANRPASPNIGDIYICTDKNGLILVCASDGSFIAGNILPSALDAWGNIILHDADNNCAALIVKRLGAEDYQALVKHNNVDCIVSDAGNMHIVGVANTTNLTHSDDANLSLTDQWVLKKTVTVPADIYKADIRVSWATGYDSGAGRDIDSQLKINSVNVGPQKYSTSSWVTHTEDTTVYAGDVIEIWARYTDTLNTGGNIKEFRIYTELKYWNTIKSAGSWAFDVEDV